MFWVHAGNLARFRESYGGIADAVKLHGRNEPGADIMRLVFRWLCNEQKGKWVMILDNADQSDVFFHPRESGKATKKSALGGNHEPSLSSFLPQTPNSTILITTRNKYTALRLTGRSQDIIEVEPMNQSEAVELLQKKLGDKYSSDKAVELVQST